MSEVLTTTKPTLRGVRVVIRDFAAADAKARLDLGLYPDILRMFGADPSSVPPLDLGQCERWISGLAARPLAWAIEHDGRWIGEIRFDALDEHDGRARLAIGIYDVDAPGRGVGREAITLLLRHAIATMRLHRVSLRVIAYNERAIRCYRACGFVDEGREREAALVGDERHDDIMMGVLARDFLRAHG